MGQGWVQICNVILERVRCVTFTVYIRRKCFVKQRHSSIQLLDIHVSQTLAA